MHLEPSTQIKALLGLIDLLERHPVLVKALLRPLANPPVISARLGVCPSQYP